QHPAQRPGVVADGYPAYPAIDSGAGGDAGALGGDHVAPHGGALLDDGPAPEHHHGLVHVAPHLHVAVEGHHRAVHVTGDDSRAVEDDHGVGAFVVLHLDPAGEHDAR